MRIDTHCICKITNSRMGLLIRLGERCVYVNNYFHLHLTLLRNEFEACRYFLVLSYPFLFFIFYIIFPLFCLYFYRNYSVQASMFIYIQRFEIVTEVNYFHCKKKQI